VWNPGGAQASDAEVSKELCAFGSFSHTLNQSFWHHCTLSA
jgi:hypothetical protein